MLRLLSVVLLLAACSSPLPIVSSGAAPNPMAVDGDAQEWEGALRPVPEEAGLSLGLRNDADALYLVVVAGDTWQARRVASRGLTVWINESGTKDKAYGLSFPVGLGSDGERGDARPRTEPGVYQPGGRVGEPLDPSGLDQRLREGFLRSLDRIEITRDGNEASVAVGGAEGIQTAATWTDAGLVVEMRVPLRDGSYAVGVPSGATLGLGVELAEVQRRGGPRQIGGTPGMADGRGSNSQREEARRRIERPQQGTVVRWMAVELAE
ncbi:MAG: hypothetical protein Rubg2KO_07360 [Rubricoccaceae bacterium]